MASLGWAFSATWAGGSSMPIPIAVLGWVRTCAAWQPAQVDCGSACAKAAAKAMARRLARIGAPREVDRGAAFAAGILVAARFGIGAGNRGVKLKLTRI